ncbi:MAG: hypothetical protein QOJ12_1512 [Thermoleophilales bacterium]|nr:hypothetical protein [Thermoleophilales bacterium]
MTALQEQDLIESASRGDEGAFRELVEPRRAELHAHCYRMLGSVDDAEDALQEALLRAWRGLPRFQGRSSLRSWLYSIATNASLDAIARRPKRVVPVDHSPAADPHDGPGEPLVESVWVEPYPDSELGVQDGFAAPEARYERRESIELAFIAALQHLPARQRAVLVLREVLGFSAQEVADALDTTTASVNSALQRARKTAEERMPEASQQATLRSIGDQRLSEVVEGYVDAWQRGDVDAVVAMLTEDATIAMPPMATWYEGRDACAVFLRDFAFAQTWVAPRFEAGDRRVRLLVTRANGQPAIAAYRWDDGAARFTPYALQVLSLREDGAITDVTGFVTTEGFTRFGLPAELAA